MGIRITARIEDVFKRTRLNVRTASLGRQIPWESTSLEEDFFFRKPSAAQLSPEQVEAQFQQQLERWTDVQSTKDIKTLQAFLLDFPSGSFSELAQFRYDRLLKEQQRIEAEKIAAQRVADEKRAAAEATAAQAQQAALAKAAQERAETARREADRLALLERAAVEDQARAQAAEQVRLPRVEQDRQEGQARAAAHRESLARDEAVKAQAAQQQKLALETQKILAAQQLLVPARQENKPRDSDVVPLGRDFAVGMRATYTQNSWATKKDEVLRYRVTQVNDTLVELNDGKVVWDLMGNVLSNRKGRYSAPRQFYPAELQVGKRWTTRLTRERADDLEEVWNINVRVAGRETIEVPAGKFDTYLIKAEGWRTIGTFQQRSEWKIWIAPGVPFDIAREQTIRNTGKLVNQLSTKLTTLKI